jgi:hypothetical protein
MNDARASRINAKQGTKKAVNTSKLGQQKDTSEREDSEDVRGESREQRGESRDERYKRRQT